MNEWIESTKKTTKELLDALYKCLPSGYIFTDLYINPNGKTFALTSKDERISLGETLSPSSILQIGTLLASLNNETLSENSPHLSASFNNNKERFEILIPPIVSAPSLSVRFHKEVPFTLQDLQNNGMLTKDQAYHLTELVLNRKNIVISGETGSGKTTLLSALLNIIDKNERLVIIEEDSAELYCSLPNYVRIVVNKGTFRGRNAVQSALRMNPDRIIYGESRTGDSALETLKAWRTGHSGGLLTLHATSASQIFDRLNDLLLEVCPSSREDLIKDTVNVRVHCSVKNGKRYVSEVLE